MSLAALYFAKFGLLALIYVFLAAVLAVIVRDLRIPGYGPLKPSSDPASEAVFWLERVEGHAEPAECPIADSLVIGRAPGCQVRVDDPFTSAQHARLEAESDGVRLADLGSSNGTFLGPGKKITTSVLLKAGETFLIGDTVLRVKKNLDRRPRLTYEATLLLGAQAVIAVALMLAWLALGGSAAAPWLAFLGVAGGWWGTYIALRIGKVRGDPLLLPLACLLSGLGWVEVYRLDSELGLKQAIWLVLGCVLLAVLCFLIKDYRKLEDYRYLYLGAAILLQASVMVFGVERNGARLWFQFGDFLFQPVEIVKILMILFVAAFLRQFRLWLKMSLWARTGPLGRSARLPRRALVMLGLGWLLAEGVLVVQRDLGMALLFFGVFLSLFYIATGRIDLVTLVFVLFLGGGWLGYQLFGHVQVRVQAWLDPFATPETGGYQMLQALFALSWGGLWGTGLGLGEPGIVPEAATDFIFVALCEELGLLGGVAILITLMLLVARVFRASIRATDEFATLLTAGLGFLMAWQSLILICGTLKLIPMTGITLPFVSYGGSSTLANFTLLALMQRLSRRGR